MEKSNKSLTNILVKVEDGFELSAYNGELTEDCIAEQTVKIASAFPSLDAGFYDILFAQVKEMNFSDKKLVDSVNHVIRNCEYPTPTIAKFLSYDKKIKLFDYTQFVNVEQHLKPLYKAVRIGGLTKQMYALKTDIETYNLELWNK